MKKILSLILSVVIIFGLLSGAAFAGTVSYSLTDAEVTVDGVEDQAVQIDFISVPGGSYYALQGKWSTEEREGTGNIRLTELIPGAAATPMENEAENGAVIWMDVSFSVPIEAGENGTIWSAVYYVDKNTPSGDYSISFVVDSISDSSSEDTAVGELFALIHVTNVSEVPVVAAEEITLDHAALELQVGESTTLSATVMPEDATDKTVTWTSSDEAVATVADGIVTAVAEGTATITAEAGERSANCTVTVTSAEPGPGTEPDPGPGPGPGDTPEPEPEDSDELKFYKERALNTLVKQFGKYTESDYDAASWSALVAAFEQGKVDIQAAKEAYGAFIEDNVTAALNTALETMQAIPAARTHPITVVVSMDANTLGLGYLIEPTLVTVNNHEQASVVIAQLIEEMAAEKYGVTGAGLSSKGTSEPREQYPWIITGSVNSGFYLAQIYWPEQENAQIPDYILSRLRAGAVLESDKSGNYLGEFDYTNMSGWMYSVSDGYETEFPGVGASGWQLSDGEVMRWQFTVFGYGADLGSENSAWGQSSIVNVGDKTELTRAVAELRSVYSDSKLKANAVYLAALDALTDPEAGQSAIDAALNALNGEDFDTTTPEQPITPGEPNDPEDPKDPETPETTEETESPFEDVAEDAWYYEPVLWAVENSITNGVSDTAFAPDASCTRAQIVTFLWRAAGSPVVESENPFEDVAEGAWYYDAVLWAVEKGITTGMTETTFVPEASCTRAQAVTFLWRANGKPAVSGTLSFADVEPESWYAPAVKWAADNGITVGVGDGLFGVGQTCTRAQIVTFLYRGEH